MKNQYSKTVVKRPISRQTVKSMIDSRIETKAASVTLTTNPVPVAGVVTYFSAIAEDDTIAGRTGLAIRPKLIEVNYGMFANANSVVRVLLVQDRLGYGTAPAVTDVLSTASYNSPHSTVAFGNQRFKYLSDRFYCFSTAGDLSHYDSVKIPMKGTVNYTGAANTQASAGANAIYVVTIASNVTVSFEMGAVIKFTDA